jgi:hypothetical protein
MMLRRPKNSIEKDFMSHMFGERANYKLNINKIQGIQRKMNGW